MNTHQQVTESNVNVASADFVASNDTLWAASLILFASDIAFCLFPFSRVIARAPN